MFKIENYITPILMNYLAKYVKNFRPKDFQMSLWEGEVLFQNLDLRLDVLKEELHIPFEILSGHIHELSIQVPWTKITSEPIRININTIEFILESKERHKDIDEQLVKKLSYNQNDNVTISECAASQASSMKKKKDEESSAISRLAKTIINNISIHCENIIFKYIEEDIVLSMNVQVLNFTSADNKWEPHVEDINVPKVVSRKLISISDITVCLDKRNSSGQIDVCHEPLLYRCSLECRILYAYNVSTKASSSTKRIGVFTKALHINLSSMQLPMLMRLIKTITTLMVSEDQTKIMKSHCENQSSINMTESISNENNVSLLSWAWSFVPSFNLNNTEEDDTNTSPGHINELGFYIEELTFTLKNSEYITDALLGGVTRVHYTPIVQFVLDGLYLETVKVKEIDWKNIKMGVCSISVKPVVSQEKNNDFDHNDAIVETVKFTNKQSFIDKSLFDEQCNTWDKNCIVTNYEDYNRYITDEYLLQRTPTFAFDEVEYCSNIGVINEQLDLSATAEFPAETKHLHKQIRVIATDVVIRYNEIFAQVNTIFKEFIKSYDDAVYSNVDKTDAYISKQDVQGPSPLKQNIGNDSNTVKDENSVTRNTTKLQPPQVEDYDQLMLGIPLCVYKIDIRHLVVKLYPKVDTHCEWEQEAERLKWLKKKEELLSYTKSTLPHISVIVDHIEGNLSMPINPDKLIHTTCQLPDKPLQLLTACYKNMHLIFSNVTANIVTPYSQCEPQQYLHYTTTCIESKILTIPNITFDYGILLQPLYWQKNEVPINHIDIQCENAKIEFSIYQFIITFLLIQTVVKYRYDLLKSLQQKLRYFDLANVNLLKMQKVLTNLKIRHRQYHTFEIWNTTLASLQVNLVLDRNNVIKETERYKVLNTSSRLHNNENKWLELQLQLPTNVLQYEKDANVEKVDIAFGLWMEKYNLNIDKHMADFLTINIDKHMANFLTTNNSMQSEEPTLRDLQSVPMNASISKQSSTSNLFQKPVVTTPTVLPSATSHFKNTLPQVFGRYGIRRLKRSSSRLEDSIYSTSEHDEKVEVKTSTSAAANLLDKVDGNGKIDNKIMDIFQQYYSIIIMMEMAQSQLCVWQSTERSEIVNFKDNFAQIALPRILWKSTFAEYITRSNLRLKTAPPPLKDTSSFNWTIHIQDLNVKIYEKNQWYAILNPWNTTLTIAMIQRLHSTNDENVERKKFSIHTGLRKITQKSVLDNRTSRINFSDLKSNCLTTYSLNLHIDSDIMYVYFNHSKCLIDQLIYLWKIFQLVQLIDGEIKGSTSKCNNVDFKTKKDIKILSYDEEDIELKEFMELDTSSNMSSAQLQITETSNFTCLTAFCQWTITKILLELQAEPTQKNKILIELEDVLFTVDCSEDFTKYTNKIGNFQLRSYELDANQCWIVNDYLSIRKIIDTSDHPFLNVVYTMANLKDFYKRLGLERKQVISLSSVMAMSPHNTISEIDIAIQAMEVIVDLKYVTQFIQPLCEAFNRNLEKSYKNTQKCNQNDNKTARNLLLITDKLPLIHFENKGITFYFPLRHLIEYCTVLICKVDNIKVSSTLKNPLQRNPLRPQVFAKATSLGILTLPGSLIEDRQYEFTLQHISAATSIWNDILIHMQNKVKIGHGNPAAEWNNPERKPDLIYNDIFKNFTFIIIYAPNIVYNNILICGAATEFNCASDFVASINTNQLTMLGCHWTSIQQIIQLSGLSCNDKPPTRIWATPSSYSEIKLYATPSSSLFSNNRSSNNSMYSINKIPIKRILQSNQTITEFLSIDENSENLINTDSGINSNSLASQQCKKNVISSLLSAESCTNTIDKISSSRTTVERYIPSTISLVAGVFIIEIFDTPKISNQHKKQSMQPLISCTISQPSFMFTQNIYDSIMQLSIFNVALHLPNIRTQMETFDSNKLTLFPIALLDTMIGEPESTGIPSTLLNYKLCITKSHRREMDIEFGRPIVLILNENYASQLCKNLLIIYNSFNENNCFKVYSGIPIKRKTTKIKLIKHKMLDIDLLDIKLNALMIKHTNPVECYTSLVLSDISLHLKYVNEPEKCLSKLNIGAFYIRTMHKIVLHPVSMKLSVDLVSEPWVRLPLLSCIVKFNVIQLDIDVDTILKCRTSLNAIQNIIECISKEWQSFWNTELCTTTSVNTPQWENSNLIKCSSSETFIKNTKYVEHDEYYQDDLRAGAFQFVEVTTDAVLPLPYQIQIIKKDYGIICWRYPQPRKMMKIFVNPIPIMSKTAAFIKCRMEYFSEVQEEFVHYCDFCLSEIVSKDVELPERFVSAYIWRIVILQPLISVNSDCFDGSEEDEELQNISSSKIDDIFSNLSDRRHVVLNPKLLVGCMRVDTIFRIENIPKVQFMLRCNEIRLEFFNQSVQNAVLPPVLRKYNLNDVAKSQAFTVFSLNSINIRGNFLTENKYNVDINLSGNITCLDYGFLNMLPLVKDTSCSCYFEVDKVKGVIITNVLFDPLHINVGPAIVHTLVTSKNHWKELLDTHDDSHIPNALIPKCIIVNHTLSKIAFGQTGTTEHIQLNSKDSYLYSFCSDYYKQELTFYVTDEKTNTIIASPSVHIPLKFEEHHIIRYVRVGDICLTLKLCKLTNYQIYILIRGQMEIVSLVSHDLFVQFRNPKSSSNTEEADVLEYTIYKHEKCSTKMSVQNTSDICVRLRLIENSSGTYTGEIPIVVNKKLPWLVKVPISPVNHITFWVRTLREDIKELWTDKFQPQRVLITIWPLYQIMSYLTRPMKLNFQQYENVVQVMEENDIYTIDLPATHLTESGVHFSFSFPVTDESQASYTFDLKALDWQRFFWYDETTLTVESALQLLSQPVKYHRPFDDENESNLKRISTNATNVDIIYNLRQSREFFSSLALEIAPWGVFINSSGLNVQISDLNHQHVTSIASNGMEMLCNLSNGFHIDVPYGLLWKSSLPIFLENESNSNFYNECHLLSKDGVCDIIITLDDKIHRLVLFLSVENNCHVIKLISKFAVVNFTKSSLYILPFAMNYTETINQQEIYNLNRKIPEIKVEAIDSLETCMGISLPIFYNICADMSSCSSKNSTHNAISYAYFVLIKSFIESDISIPVLLEMPFKRRCISIQNGKESLPLALTLSEKNSIFYLSLAEDIYPALIITNETECSFLIGETKASESCTTVAVTCEYEKHHFDWYQKVPQQSQTYYTPPVCYVNFPEMDTTLCNITLALWNDGTSGRPVKWSKPMSINKAHKNFLHVPGHGEVQVIICNKHRIVRLTIAYVSQQTEFSIKDLRSRLSTTRGMALSEETNARELSKTHYSKLHLSKSSEICWHFRNNVINRNQVKLRLYVKEITFSLHIDSSEKQYLKQDVFSLCMNDVLLAYDDTKGNNREINILIPNLQIDNQLFSTGRFDFPVIFCSEQLYEEISHKPQAYYLDETYENLKQTTSLLDVKLTLYRDEYKIHSLKCSLCPVRAYIEDAYVAELLDALVECSPTNCAYITKLQFERRLIEANQILIPSDVVAAVLYFKDPLYLKSFLIEPINVLLSVHTSVRLYIALDHSPLSFSTYKRDHLLTVPLKLGQSLGMHYLSGAIFGAGWVVGSLEILGSPSGLARSVTMGLKDFISLPVRGLFRGPWGFILGITQGSASLFKNVTAGTVNSVTKLAASVARNLDRLSLDNEHIERTESLRRIRPQGFTDGIYQGMTGLGISILGAVGGLAHHTLDAKCTSEVFTGVGKGLMGALTKPISGAAELVALAGQGMLQTVGFNALPKQRYPSNTRNIAVAPSLSRLWKILPTEFLSDQILFYNEITPVTKEDFPGRTYICLTSTIFIAIARDCNQLKVAYPIDKMDFVIDDNDKTLCYVRLKSERDNFTEISRYTAERIINFLQNSNTNLTSPLLVNSIYPRYTVTHDNSQEYSNYDYAFHINECFAEFILRYIKILSIHHLHT